jgi:hypothetical protein
MSSPTTTYDSNNLDVDYIDEETAVNQYNKDKEQDVQKYNEQAKANEAESGNPENAKSGDSSTTFSDLATKTNLVLILTFLGIYFIIYFVVGKFFNKGESPNSFNLSLSRSLDILFFGLLTIIAYTTYQSYEQAPDRSIFGEMITSFTGFVNKPSSAFIIGMFIIIFYLVNYLFRIPMETDTKPFFISIIETMAWVILVIILFIDFFKYVLKISLYDLFPSLNSTEKEVTAVENPDTNVPKLEKCETEPKDDPESEVFNISNNKYTYDDAQAICKSYDASLATYDQIERAYNNGAEWCNYGWSDGQMILFPTQKKTWNKLQKLDEKRSCNSKTPSHKNDCGRPGINGGYIANPYVKFGVNCFGKKPEPSDADTLRMNANQNQTYPKTAKDIQFEKKVNYWKDNADKFLHINSYNTTAWNKSTKSVTTPTPTP